MSRIGNPNWKKGVSGNPEGRKPTHFGKYLRDHPDTPLILEKIIEAALDDDDPRQKDAWKLIAGKIAPDLKAQEIRADVSTHVGVIQLPMKKDIDTIDPPTPTPLIPSTNAPHSPGPQKIIDPENVAQIDEEVHDHPMGVGFAQKDLKTPPTSEKGDPITVNGTKDKI